MKKTTKGALAAVMGGSLLLGGAGSLAFWTGNSTVTGASITSGSLTLGTPDCTVAPGTHDWEFDGGDPFVPASDTIVPGDTISKTCAIDLTVVGNHVGATLAVDPAAWVASNGLSDELDPTAVFTVDGNPVTDPITAPGTYVVLAEISVDFDGASATNGSESLTAALDDIVVTATQTHDA